MNGDERAAAIALAGSTVVCGGLAKSVTGGLSPTCAGARASPQQANQPHRNNQPFVGSSAFAHKGGLHVSAVEKDPKTYEHVDPELIGNQRVIVVSAQAGRSNIMARYRQNGLEVDPKDPGVARLLGQTTGAATVALVFTAFPDSGPVSALLIAAGAAALGACISASRLAA